MNRSFCDEKIRDIHNYTYAGGFNNVLKNMFNTASKK